MIHTQATKFVSITPPQAIVDDAAYTTAEIDTLGWEHLQIVAYLGASDIAMAALKVTESATAGSGHADVTGLVFGTSVNTDGSASTLPSASDDNKFFVFDIDLKARQRYIDLVATAGNGSTGTYLTAFGILSRGHKTPMTATERGAAQVLRV